MRECLKCHHMIGDHELVTEAFAPGWSDGYKGYDCQFHGCHCNIGDFEMDTYREALPYQTHSATSFAAAQAKPDAGKQRAEVLAWFRARGERGATDEECQIAMGLAGSSQRPRRVELVSRGLLVDTGLTRKTMAGRTAAVWRAKT